MDQDRANAARSTTTRAAVNAEISVIIPARNAASTISDTLASLATEADRIREIILIDDDSGDGTAALARGIGQRLGLPLRTITVEAHNAGTARNAGLREIAGQYVYFIDADDLHMPGGLRKLHNALQAHPDAGMAVGAFTRSLDDGKQRLKRPSGFKSDRVRNAENLLKEKIRSLAVGSVLLRRSTIEGINFPEGLAYDEDTVFWARVLLKTDPLVVREPILTYRVVSKRANDRFLRRPCREFLNWLREVRRLQPDGVARGAVTARAAIVAGKLARTHYAEGDRELGDRFVRLALKISGFGWGYMRLLRYQAKIARMSPASSTKSHGR